MYTFFWFHSSVPCVSYVICSHLYQCTGCLPQDLCSCQTHEIWTPEEPSLAENYCQNERNSRSPQSQGTSNFNEQFKQRKVKRKAKTDTQTDVIQPQNRSDILNDTTRTIQEKCQEDWGGEQLYLPGGASQTPEKGPPPHVEALHLGAENGGCDSQRQVALLHSPTISKGDPGRELCTSLWGHMYWPRCCLESRELFNPETRTIDFSKLEATDLRDNPRVTLPRPRPSDVRYALRVYPHQQHKILYATW